MPIPLRPLPSSHTYIHTHRYTRTYIPGRYASIEISWSPFESLAITRAVLDSKTFHKQKKRCGCLFLKNCTIFALEVNNIQRLCSSLTFQNIYILDSKRSLSIEIEKFPNSLWVLILNGRQGDPMRSTTLSAGIRGPLFRRKTPLTEGESAQ